MDAATWNKRAFCCLIVLTPVILLASIKVLVSTTQVENKVFAAIRLGKEHRALELLDIHRNRLQVDYQGINGVTMLFFAAQHGQEAVVRALLESHGADPRIVNEQGVTPLMVAAQNGSVATCAALLRPSHGRALVNAQSSQGYGWTALLLAVRHRHSRVVRLLLRHGADANVCSRSDHACPVLLAVQNNDVATLRALLSANGPMQDSLAGVPRLRNPLECRRDGVCPLPLARRLNNPHLLHLLLAAKQLPAN